MFEVRADDLSGFPRPRIRARDDSLDRKAFEVLSDLLRLALSGFREVAFLALADMLRVQECLAVADEIESSRSHEKHHAADCAEGDTTDESDRSGRHTSAFSIT